MPAYGWDESYQSHIKSLGKGNLSGGNFDNCIDMKFSGRISYYTVHISITKSPTIVKVSTTCGPMNQVYLPYKSRYFKSDSFQG